MTKEEIRKLLQLMAKAKKECDRQEFMNELNDFAQENVLEYQDAVLLGMDISNDAVREWHETCKKRAAEIEQGLDIDPFFLF